MIGTYLKKTPHIWIKIFQKQMYVYIYIFFMYM